MLFRIHYTSSTITNPLSKNWSTQQDHLCINHYPLCNMNDPLLMICYVRSIINDPLNTIHFARSTMQDALCWIRYVVSTMLDQIYKIHYIWSTILDSISTIHLWWITLQTYYAGSTKQDLLTRSYLQFPIQNSICVIHYIWPIWPNYVWFTLHGHFAGYTRPDALYVVHYIWQICWI